MDKDRGDLSDDDFAEVDREMLMMPHKSRKQREYFKSQLCSLVEAWIDIPLECSKEMCSMVFVSCHPLTLRL